MSKWIDKDLFNDFQKEKQEEKETAGNVLRRSELLWETPEKGTQEKAKVYEGRFVPDVKGKFYKKYYYHMWQSGDNWVFVLCPKTHGWDSYCPICSVTGKLYKGTKQDQSHAYNIKRKEKFVGNFFLVKDPRDADRDEDRKVLNTVRLYEFPGKVEQKLKNEVTDRSEGYGHEIFDPGEEGRNFILKVLCTKPQEGGKTWPDYSSSTFSRTQGALGTEEEIDEIMKNTTNLEEYVSSMDMEPIKMIEILKNEFLWEMVEDEAKKYGFKDTSKKQEEVKTPKETKKPEAAAKEEKDGPPWSTDEEKKEPKDEPKEEAKEAPATEETTPTDDDQDDADLLAELDAM